MGDGVSSLTQFGEWGTDRSWGRGKGGQLWEGIANLETTLSNTVNDWYSGPTLSNLKGKMKTFSL